MQTSTMDYEEDDLPPQSSSTTPTSRTSTIWRLEEKLSCNSMCVFSYTCGYIYAPHRCVVPLNSSRGCQICWNWSHRQSWASVWMLGTEHWYPARTTSTFNPWETSPDQTLTSFLHSRDRNVVHILPPLLQPSFLRLIFPPLIFVLQGFAQEVI